MNKKRTAQFYIANLGSEIVGIYSAMEKRDKIQTENCYGRARAIIEDCKNTEHRQNALAEIDLLSKITDDLLKTASTRPASIFITEYYNGINRYLAI